MLRPSSRSIAGTGGGAAARPGRFMTAACLVLGVAALAASIHLGSTPARAEARAEAPRLRERPALAATATAPGKGAPTRSPASSPASSPTSSPASSPSAKLPSSSGVQVAKAIVPTTTAATPTDTAGSAAVAPLVVPDFKGKRLSAAWREARELGIVVAARNEDGGRVPVGLARYYRVRKQLTQAGSAIEPGAKVELRVRELPEAFDGY